MILLDARHCLSVARKASCRRCDVHLIRIPVTVYLSGCVARSLSGASGRRTKIAKIIEPARPGLQAAAQNGDGVVSLGRLCPAADGEGSKSRSPETSMPSGRKLQSRHGYRIVHNLGAFMNVQAYHGTGPRARWVASGVGHGQSIPDIEQLMDRLTGAAISAGSRRDTLWKH